MQKITPFLWFNNNAEEAMHFYLSVFKDAAIKNIVRNGAAGPGPEGSVLTASFTLCGQEFVVLNGGPQFHFTEAVSFVVNCETQAEIDEYWSKLTAGGGQESMCGWLKDKYGLSWQVVPVQLPCMLQDTDPQRAKRVVGALMQMRKLDLGELQKAWEG